MVCREKVGEALGLPGCSRRRFVAPIQLSLGRLLLSRACFCFTGQSQRHFPFPFPWGSIGRETGNDRLSW